MQECNYRENQCRNCRIIVRHFIYPLSVTVAAAGAVAAGVVAVAAVLVVLAHPPPFSLHCEKSSYASKGHVRGPSCCRCNRGITSKISCSPAPSQKSSRLYNKTSESTTRVPARIGKKTRPASSVGLGRARGRG